MLAFVPFAFPCGGFVAPPDGFAVSDTQEVIFALEADRVRVDYRVLYEGDTETFGWVIPIPGAFVSLEDGEADDFTDLRDATRPEEDFVATDGGGCRDGTRNSKGDLAGGDTAAEGGVDVVASGYTGTYAYDVLDATSADALTGWLSTHGFELGPNSDAVGEYVAEGKWLFVALALEGEPTSTGYDTAGQLQVEVPPVTIVYEGSDMSYPARMGRGSTATSMHSILYVRGDQRASISGWGEDVIDRVGEAGESADFVENEMWPARLGEAGSQTKYGLVFAGELDGTWVTRFETLAAPAANTVDAVFALDGGTTAHRTVLTNRGEDGCGGGSSAWLLLLPGLWLRRRR
jgi:hypothetical protein